jgi:hypothetical protein
LAEHGGGEDHGIGKRSKRWLEKAEANMQRIAYNTSAYRAGRKRKPTKAYLF